MADSTPDSDTGVLLLVALVALLAVLAGLYVAFQDDAVDAVVVPVETAPVVQ